LLGHAKTGNFRPGSGDAEISESVGIVDRADRIDGGFKLERELLDCVTRETNSGKLDNEDFSYSGAKLSTLAVPAVGDRAEAYRWSFHVKAKKQSGPDSEGDAFVDFVLIAKGKIAMALFASNFNQRFDQALRDDLAAKAAAKVK
jgi:hypothetical protein